MRVFSQKNDVSGKIVKINENCKSLKDYDTMKSVKIHDVNDLLFLFSRYLIDKISRNKSEISLSILRNELCKFLGISNNGVIFYYSSIPKIYVDLSNHLNESYFSSMMFVDDYILSLLLEGTEIYCSVKKKKRVLNKMELFSKFRNYLSITKANFLYYIALNSVEETEGNFLFFDDIIYLTLLFDSEIILNEDIFDIFERCGTFTDGVSKQDIVINTSHIPNFSSINEYLLYVLQMDVDETISCKYLEYTSENKIDSSNIFLKTEDVIDSIISKSFNSPSLLQGFEIDIHEFIKSKNIRIYFSDKNTNIMNISNMIRDEDGIIQIFTELQFFEKTSDENYEEFELFHESIRDSILDSSSQLIKSGTSLEIVSKFCIHFFIYEAELLSQFDIFKYCFDENNLQEVSIDVIISFISTYIFDKELKLSKMFSDNPYMIMILSLFCHFFKINKYDYSFQGYIDYCIKNGRIERIPSCKYSFRVSILKSLEIYFDDEKEENMLLFIADSYVFNDSKIECDDFFIREIYPSQNLSVLFEGNLFLEKIRFMSFSFPLQIIKFVNEQIKNRRISRKNSQKIKLLLEDIEYCSKRMFGFIYSSEIEDSLSKFPERIKHSDENKFVCLGDIRKKYILERGNVELESFMNFILCSSSYKNISKFCRYNINEHEDSIFDKLCKYINMLNFTNVNSSDIDLIADIIIEIHEKTFT